MRQICWLVVSISVVLGPIASAQDVVSAPSIGRVRLAQHSPCAAVIEEARTLDVAMYRSGFGLTPGKFYMLQQACPRLGTSVDFRLMLFDRTPLVRVMGLISLAQSVVPEEFVKIAKQMGGDTAVLRYTNGCILDQRATVGDIARLLAEGRFFHAGDDRVHYER